MVAKKYQNPKGGLNAKGRSFFKRKQGSNLKPPVTKKEAEKSPSKAARRKSFCARMKGVKGPLYDKNGKPTRKKLALDRWEC